MRGCTGWRSGACLLLSLAAILPAQPTAARILQDDAECLALSMYFEARDDGRAGMEAVGWVILNRVAAAEFPDTVCGVVEEGGETPPCQFSWWCDGKSDRPKEADRWALAREIAGELLTDPPPDPTGDALFFHSREVAPPWAGLEPTAKIGTHVFFR